MRRYQSTGSPKPSIDPKHSTLAEILLLGFAPLLQSRWMFFLSDSAWSGLLRASQRDSNNHRNIIWRRTYMFHIPFHYNISGLFQKPHACLHFSSSSSLQRGKTTLKLRGEKNRLRAAVLLHRCPLKSNRWSCVGNPSMKFKNFHPVSWTPTLEGQGLDHSCSEMAKPIYPNPIALSHETHSGTIESNYQI